MIIHASSPRVVTGAACASDPVLTPNPLLQRREGKFELIIMELISTPMIKIQIPFEQDGTTNINIRPPKGALILLDRKLF